MDQNFSDIRVRADVADSEIGALPEFKTSEEWVLGMDAWSAEYEIPDWESCAGKYGAIPPAFSVNREPRGGERGGGEGRGNTTICNLYSPGRWVASSLASCTSFMLATVAVCFGVVFFDASLMMMMSYRTLHSKGKEWRRHGRRLEGVGRCRFGVNVQD